MNYQRYIRSRMFDVGYIKARLQRLFRVLSDADYEGLQEHLAEAEGILKKYVSGESEHGKTDQTSGKPL